MKTIFQNRFVLGVVLISIITVISCTKLDTEIELPNSIQPATAGTAPTPSSLSKVYESLNGYIGNGGWFAMQEHTTDEMMGPTRGTDWDDFSEWRELHLHTWGGLHPEINNAWNNINSGLFQTTLLAEATGASASDVLEARFLRAFISFIGCDLFGQVQHRPATAAASDFPDVFTRSEACDFIISELEAIIPSLPAYTHADRVKATKEAAQFLLARTYLNKAVFKQDPTQPAGPFTFNAADMTKVIDLVNAISANSALSISDYYWDNFTWDNGTKSTENIFVRPQSGGINVVYYSCMGNHYFMTPDGWNGFVTLADFYNSFEDLDIRKEADIAGYSSLTGRPAGFLIGQQRGPTEKKIGNPIVDLKDRSGNLLIFTADCPIVSASEAKGIRTNKYPLDPAEMNGGGWGSKNDYVFFRLSDALLMKAEALLRGGTDGGSPVQTADDIVTAIRAKREGSGALEDITPITLDKLLAERGRELYLEGVRRDDVIRFGKFNAPVMERPLTSDAYRVVFPIPTIPLASNPNLQQNFGYQ